MVVSYTIDTLATDRGTLDLQSLRQLAYKLLGHWPCLYRGDRQVYPLIAVTPNPVPQTTQDPSVDIATAHWSQKWPRQDGGRSHDLRDVASPFEIPPLLLVTLAPPLAPEKVMMITGQIARQS